MQFGPSKIRKDSIMSRGVKVPSKAPSTMLFNSIEEFFNNEEIITLIEERLGNTYHFLEETDTKEHFRIGKGLLSVSKEFNEIMRIQKNIPKNTVLKQNFAYEFGQHFGYFKESK
ncbi:hypothetical protein DID77_02990 [Candidatus Marinamargulisbacteria bacterium SCGC AG-439-L15]|nr:hypothetical protein DID77_02990 [Candidatus Marinamargulisbacteria bacterium SCGC AG-439-L15]